MKSDSHDDMDLIRQQLQQSRAGAVSGFQPLTIKAPVRQKPAAKQEVLEMDPELIEKNKRAIKTGYQTLLEEIQKLAKQDVLTLDDLEEPLPVSAFQIKDEVLEVLADKKADGITLVGCSEQSLLGFYLIAKKLYDDKQLDEAVNAFILLTHIAPEVSPFWLGLGLSYEAKQDWIEARNALQKAIEANPADFTPFQVLIRMAAETHDFEPVKELLESHKEKPELKEEVAAALQHLPQIMKGGL